MHSSLSRDAGPRRAANPLPSPPIAVIRPILAAMRQVEGWFSESEAELLAAAAKTAVDVSPTPNNFVEVGSYCGRSTLVLGGVVRALGGSCERVFAVDPHEGTVGAVGQGLVSGEPTIDRFRKTICEAGLGQVVKEVVARAEYITLDVPLSLIFIDGLHDYANVCGDITQFQGQLLPGGLLACHDYADYYPGVRRAVDDLTATGAYELVRQVQSLVVLRKLAEPGLPPLHGCITAAMDIDGWYDRDELTYLAWTAALVLSGRSDDAGDVVEVGCHLGRASAVLAAVSSRVNGDRPCVHVVDRFDGLLGAVGEQLWQGEPTYERFATNLARLNLETAVRTIVRDGRASAKIGQPVALLVVNDLHDYGSVAEDLRDFEPHLTCDAVVAFHNYGPYWPGVRTVVDELVNTRRYTWRGLVGTLAVLDRAVTPTVSKVPSRRRQSGRNVAVFTCVADESFFLPIWLRYYSRFVGQENLYVVDHDSSDGSTDGEGFVRIPVHNPVTDWAWLWSLVQAEQHRLLERYDAVLYTDVDEIITPDPAYGDLRRYLDEFNDDFVTCRGWELLHDWPAEPALDPDGPIMAQRHWWYRNTAYDKPLLARVAMSWRGGFHGRTDGAVKDDPRLFLIHLHRVDYEQCLYRHRQRVARPWKPEQIADGWGFHERIVEPEAFARWFFNDANGSGREVYEIERQPIPPRWRHVF
jgi:Methyltransferase domain